MVRQEESCTLPPMHRLAFPLTVVALCLIGCAAPSPRPTEVPVPVPVGAESGATLSEGLLEPGDIPQIPAPQSASGTMTMEATSSSAGPDYAVQERLGSGSNLEIGRVDAPLTLDVYTNFSCAYCAQFSREQLPKLLAGFVRSGKLLIRIRVLPLEKYPASRAEASALLCAAEQQKGRLMQDALFALPTHTDIAIGNAATSIDVEKTAFDACRTSPQTIAIISAQTEAASASGITLVPTFFIGSERITGLPEYADLRGLIEQKIAQ